MLGLILVVAWLSAGMIAATCYLMFQKLTDGPTHSAEDRAGWTVACFLFGPVVLSFQLWIGVYWLLDWATDRAAGIQR